MLYFINNGKIINENKYWESNYKRQFNGFFLFFRKNNSFQKSPYIPRTLIFVTWISGGGKCELYSSKYGNHPVYT
jgi:hypothetical protein